MGKKKFDLTTDIINNGLKTETAALHIEENNKQPVKVNDINFKQSDSITIRTLSSTKQEFKLYCVQNQLTMHEAFQKAFELLKSSVKN